MISGRCINLSGSCLHGGDNSKSCIAMALRALKINRKKLLPSLPDKLNHPTSYFVFLYCTVLFMVKSFNSLTCQSLKVS